MILNASTLPLGPYVVPYLVGYLEIIFQKNYLFTWLHLVFTVAHGLSLTVSLGLSSCGTQAQLSRGLRNLPGAGIEPVSLHWQADSQPLHHQGVHKQPSY